MAELRYVITARGIGVVLNDHASGRIRFQRLSRTGSAWADIRTSLDIATVALSVTLDRFSTFRLAWSPLQPLPTVTPVDNLTRQVEIPLGPPF